ncbi:cysteine dioxygenase family protein [Streptomyces sp. NRRL B-1347]|uniref:cysteine dioxygenase family protein n=1 Tax=Streptomyces sp. NRRL B-1347 TaxID=1476877 RepID=UPI0004C92B1F|nr:cysteine dioxygenase family protein [Streptomyces sp. NRRL B-1347]
MTTVTARMAEMVSELRNRIGAPALADAGDPEPWTTAGDVLAAFLDDPDLLTPEQWEADPHAYRQHLLHAEPDGSFSVVALVWLPGQETPVHDHVAWCVVGVHRGEEVEEHFRVATDDHGPHLVRVARSVNAEGSVTSVCPPGDVHLVRNGTTHKVVSLHIYGANVAARGTSIRRSYDLPVRDLPVDDLPVGDLSVRDVPVRT